MRLFQLFIIVLLLPFSMVGQTITVTPESKTVGVGDTFTVDISLTGFSGALATAQGTLEWDPDVLFFDPTLPNAVSNFGLPQMTVSDFGFSNTIQGELFCAWSFPGSNPPPFNPVWFRVRFIVVGDFGSSSPLQLVDGPPIGGTPVEFSYLQILGPFVAIPIALDVTSVQATITVGTGFPVTWASVDAEKTEQGVDVTWETATEFNTDFFEVERLTESGEYLPVGKVSAAGTSDNLISYRFSDLNAPLGALRYRVKQVDIDGQFSYSRSVEVVNSREQIYLYPNPTDGEISIALSDEFAKQATLVVRDMQGRVVRKSNSSGLETVTLNLTDLVSGWYSVEAISDSGQRIETRVFKR